MTVIFDRIAKNSAISCGIIARILGEHRAVFSLCGNYSDIFLFVVHFDIYEREYTPNRPKNQVIGLYSPPPLSASLKRYVTLDQSTSSVIVKPLDRNPGPAVVRSTIYLFCGWIIARQVTAGSRSSLPYYSFFTTKESKEREEKATKCATMIRGRLRHLSLPVVLMNGYRLVYIWLKSEKAGTITPKKRKSVINPRTAASENKMEGKPNKPSSHFLAFTPALNVLLIFGLSLSWYNLFHVITRSKKVKFQTYSPGLNGCGDYEGSMPVPAVSLCPRCSLPNRSIQPPDSGMRWGTGPAFAQQVK